jgi:hypothetical protein
MTPSTTKHTSFDANSLFYNLPKVAKESTNIMVSLLDPPPLMIFWNSTILEPSSNFDYQELYYLITIE